jgi:hypothetical protein
MEFWKYGKEYMKNEDQIKYSRKILFVPKGFNTPPFKAVKKVLNP